MSVAVPPAPPPPIYSRGEHHRRIGRHRVLVIFVGVLVVGVAIATLLVKGNAPPVPRPVCPTLPCGKPPTPPTSTAGAFVPGTPFTSSRYGYRFDFDPADGFVPELSIQENCWHSEGNGQSDFGFFLDGPGDGDSLRRREISVPNH